MDVLRGWLTCTMPISAARWNCGTSTWHSAHVMSRVPWTGSLVHPARCEHMRTGQGQPRFPLPFPSRPASAARRKNTLRGTCNKIAEAACRHLPPTGPRPPQGGKTHCAGHVIKETLYRGAFSTAQGFLSSLFFYIVFNLISFISLRFSLLLYCIDRFGSPCSLL